jgi:hypothetical protein
MIMHLLAYDNRKQLGDVFAREWQSVHSNGGAVRRMMEVIA